LIVDFHTHFHAGQGPVENLIAAMDEQGVDVAVICCVPAPGGDYGQAANDLVAEAIAAHPSRLVGLVGLVPYHPGAPALLERYVERGFRGAKIHPSIQRFYSSERRIYALVEKAIALDVPILIHTSAVPIPGTRSRFDDPFEVDDLAAAYPEAKLVLAHGDPFGPGPAIAGKHPNVYMDTTGVFARRCRLIPGLGEDTLAFMGSVNGVHGSRKTLFGSDANPAKPERVRENLEPLHALDLPQEQKELILGGNAVRLLKLG
jgi:predicted TIM-barrel fold metal-dependent hydrolase